MGRTMRMSTSRPKLIAFGHVGLNWRNYVVIDPQYYRPAEVDLLLADPSKARQRLRWEPEVGFEKLVTMMADADLAALAKQKQTGVRVAA